ncbi:polypyrimidine tract-binding protein 2-like isoform X2 [Sycon ciliatum]|uniref:polypyrimidine tract-binding protein 2-like isoform X2 n=1 Tax=Sycon ciliatum TaxID=27933 RepID=UPI0020A9CCDB|eukprot:scpid38387/ scgid30354/ Polypyrimidine tract-binding protein 2; Neural polypyrimidine tract-binding protein; PTB-like protein &gt; Polypyrimidine tract-binding protein 2; Brain-enriched polypyrimidine tract-binding protein; Neural polypyrimidine tract-binding protein; RRM-type RNA-binding protein brPTB
MAQNSTQASKAALDATATNGQSSASVVVQNGALPPVTAASVAVATSTAPVTSAESVSVAAAAAAGGATADSTASAGAVAAGPSNGDAPVTPSRVLHVRHLPQESTELQVAALGAPFGRVLHVMLLRQRNQAFLEMVDEPSATAAVNYYNYVSANINGVTVYIQFSIHKELRITQNSGTTSPPANGPADNKADPTVLHIIVDNMVYSVNLDTLHTIFMKFGNVLRIITFNKNGQFQALIEFADTASATQAKYSLDGQNIYDRCCVMRIEISKLRSLMVKANNERQRDYTRMDGENQQQQQAQAGPPAHAMGPPYGPGVPGLLGQGPMMGPGPEVPRHMVPFMSKQMMPPPMPPMMNMPQVYPGVPPVMVGSPVLLVSNLNEQQITPTNLFMLFGVYGDVQRVKILFNKKDAALIQMTSPFQAHTAQNYLNKVSLYGKDMHITISKHTHVSLPREGQEGAELTKDFAGSPLHRFKGTSHNYQNIFQPSACLHLSNIPSDITEEFLREKFSAFEGTVVALRWIMLKDEEKFKDRRMCLIQMSSVEVAVQALVNLHNLHLAEKRYLRVSFAKSPVLS